MSAAKHEDRYNNGNGITRGEYKEKTLTNVVWCELCVGVNWNVLEYPFFENVGRLSIDLFVNTDTML